MSLEVQRAIANARALNAELGKVDKAAQQAHRTMSQVGASTQTASRGRGGTGGVEDRYAMREYQGRVAWQRKLEQDTDRHLIREYQGRVRYEQKKETEQARAAARAATTKQAEADKLASIEASYQQKDYSRRVAHERRKEQDQARATTRAAASRQKDADKLSAIESGYIQRDYSRRVAYERRREQDQTRAANRAVALKDREQAQLKAVEDRWLRREQRDRVAFQRRKDEKAAADTEAAAGEDRAFLGHAATAAFAAITAQVVALSAAFEKAQARLSEAADATIRMRDSIRMEAALAGFGRTTNQALQSNLEFRAKTGLGMNEASDFTRQFEGSLPIGIEKGNITRQVADDLKVAAGIRANRLGGDMGTHGDLAGILGQYGKVNSAQHGLSQLEAVRWALTAGRGDDPVLTRGLLEASGATVREGGAVGNLPEMAALVGVMSLSAGASQAGTRTEQLIRGLRVGMTKHRKVKGAESSQADYLKGLGFTEKDSIEEMLDKIVPDIVKAEGAGRDASVYLAEHGFRNEEERRALVEVAHNYQPLKQRFAETRKRMNTFGPGEQATNQAFLDSPQGRAGVAGAMKDTAQVSLGLRHEKWKVLLEEAESDPEFQKTEQDWGLSFADRMTGYAAGHFSDPVAAGREKRLSRFARERLNKRARAAGIGDEELQGTLQESFGHDKSWYEINSDYANRVEKMIAEKGGSTAADTAPQMERLAKAIEENNKLLADQARRNGGGQAPPALPGPPRGGAVRP
ncbi:MAG: hypothetical protein P4L84_33050 [Isosphaeraceae bacterium]|nr:hypothetical protein [Isosphaeraceae bacterium]